MAKGKVKKVYPGGNTSLGFFSYYDYIIEPDATRIIVIKGGPGVGKSSFMKALAEELNEQGFDLEMHYCSSDNNSLDGVVFPEIRVALIDGTSPHIVDPRNPGAVDEILHLGDYWNEKGIRKSKEQILEFNMEVGRLFKRAYQYLKAAKVIHDDLEIINSENFNYGLANQKGADLLEAIFEGRAVSVKAGKIRKLFASAITPNGFCNFLPTLFGDLPIIYAVTGAPGTGKSTLLKKIADSAIEQGLTVEAYYCAFDPLKIEHLVIKELGTGVTTAVEPHQYDLTKVSGVINMDECLAPNIITKYGAIIDYNQRMRAELLEKAIFFINKAKSVHDQMEQHYVPNMNFSAIGDLREKVLKRILEYAAEYGL